MPYLFKGQALKAIVDCEHVVALENAHPHSGTHGRVHASAGGARV